MINRIVTKTQAARCLRGELWCTIASSPTGDGARTCLANCAAGGRTGDVCHVAVVHGATESRPVQRFAGRFVHPVYSRLPVTRDKPGQRVEDNALMGMWSRSSMSRSCWAGRPSVVDRKSVV